MASEQCALKVFEEGNKKIFCFRSGMTVFEEVFENGLYYSAGSNAAGYPLNVLNTQDTRLDPRRFAECSAFGIELDGVDCTRRLILENYEEETVNSLLKTKITLKSSVKPVRFVIHTDIDSTGVLTRHLTIENLSDTPMALSRLMLHGGGLESLDLGDNSWCGRPDRNQLYSVGFFDSDNAGFEGEFVRRPLPNGTFTVDSRFSDDRFRHPAVFIFNDALGKVFFSQLGYSGGCRFSVKLNSSSPSSCADLSYSAEITAYTPLTGIMPGEAFETPEVFFGLVHGGLDEAVNAMNAHLRRSVLTEPAPCLIGGGMGPEHDMSVETTRQYMEQLSSMGAEVFIIDAGWVCPPDRQNEWWSLNGLNRIDKGRYPDNSFEELRAYCHSLGMKFGMWMEIERAGRDSGLFDLHPDWFAEDIAGNKDGMLLDLTVPDAFDWALSELRYVITEYRLDLLRVDYNIDRRTLFRFRDLGAGEECLNLRHTDAVYRLYGTLKAEFPDVIFENCASGGGRTDLGIMRFFNHTWVSDNQKLPRSTAITNGMTMVLPPERVDRLFAGMGCHQYGSLDAHMRNTMLGHMSLNVIASTGSQANSEAMEFISHSTEVYKSFIRPFINSALIFHHTPELSDAAAAGAFITELAASDKSRAAVTVISLPGSGTTLQFFPKGLDHGKKYSVTFDNSHSTFEMSGAELMQKGLRVTLPSALSSELIMFEAQ